MYRDSRRTSSNDSKSTKTSTLNIHPRERYREQIRLTYAHLFLCETSQIMREMSLKATRDESYSLSLEIQSALVPFSPEREYLGFYLSQRPSPRIYDMHHQVHTNLSHLLDSHRTHLHQSPNIMGDPGWSHRVTRVGVRSK